MNGRTFLREFKLHAMQKTQILDDAENALSIAVQRNPDDYKNFDALTDVYSSWAKLQPGQKNQWLTKALDTASTAVLLYPGDAELHFRLARIAEDLANPDVSLKHYQKAVQIEDSFREQFRLMYPGREVISRMPEEEYLLAKNRVKILSDKPPVSK
jgi:tetratricopeptide (TPR) repeat protein